MSNEKNDNKYFGFEEQLKVGKIGEQLAKKAIKQIYPTMSILDVSSDKYYQAKGIDFLLKRKYGRKCRPLKIDVKADWTEQWTGNIAYEIWSDYGKKEGCFKTSEADYFLYVFPNFGHVLLIDMPRLRAHVEPKINDYRHCKIQNYRAVGEVALIPIREICDGKIAVIWPMMMGTNREVK